MRDAVDTFTAAGGMVARLAGNFFWQVRFEDNGATQVCYKYAALKDGVWLSLTDSRDAKLAQAYTSIPRSSLGDSSTQPLAFAGCRPGPWDGAAAQADVSVGSRADWAPRCRHVRTERYSGTLLSHELGRNGEFSFGERSCDG